MRASSGRTASSKACARSSPAATAPTGSSGSGTRTGTSSRSSARSQARPRPSRRRRSDVLQAGDLLPEATVFLGPRQPMSLTELIGDGPKLLLFYPFDWSSTCMNEVELVRDRRAEFDE